MPSPTKQVLRGPGHSNVPPLPDRRPVGDTTMRALWLCPVMLQHAIGPA